MKNKKLKKVIRNYCAKYMNEFNTPKTEVDRKKRDKNGYEKHKGKLIND